MAVSLWQYNTTYAQVTQYTYLIHTITQNNTIKNKQNKEK
jgi:hypothetical protein